MQSEKKFIVDGIKQGLRCDGRALLTSRRIQIHKGISVLSAGSAHLNIELSSPHIICGCKLEIAIPEKEDEGIVNFTIEFAGKSTISVKEKIAEVKNIIDTLVISHFDKKQLCILKGRKCWKLHMDVEILDKDASNLVEHIVYTLRAALEDTKIMKTEAIINKNTKEEFVDVLDETIGLNIDNLPVIIALGQINGSFVLDLSSEEELCAESLLFFAFDKSGAIKGIIKENPGRLTIEHVLSAVQTARDASSQIFCELENGTNLRYKL